MAGFMDQVAAALRGMVGDEATKRRRDLTELGPAVMRRNGMTLDQLAKAVRDQHGKLPGLSKGNLSKAETRYAYLVMEGLEYHRVDDLVEYTLPRLYYTACSVRDGALRHDEVLQALADGDPRTMAPKRETTPSEPEPEPEPAAGGSTHPDGYRAWYLSVELAERIDEVARPDETTEDLMAEAIEVLVVARKRAEARGLSALDWVQRAAARDAVVNG